MMKLTILQKQNNMFRSQFNITCIILAIIKMWSFVVSFNEIFCWVSQTKNHARSQLLLAKDSVVCFPVSFLYKIAFYDTSLAANGTSFQKESRYFYGLFSFQCVCKPIKSLCFRNLSSFLKL